MEIENKIIVLIGILTIVWSFWVFANFPSSIQEKEVIKTATTTIEYRTESIFFVDEKTVSRLPHCALNWDNSKNEPYNKYWCSDSFDSDIIVIKKVK